MYVFQIKPLKTALPEVVGLDHDNIFQHVSQSLIMYLFSIYQECLYQWACNVEGEKWEQRKISINQSIFVLPFLNNQSWLPCIDGRLYSKVAELIIFCYWHICAELLKNTLNHAYLICLSSAGCQASMIFNFFIMPFYW